MFRLLGQRAALRAYATNASRLAPMTFSPLATRSPVHTRSFLTTGSVSTAEASATEADSTETSSIPKVKGRPRKTSGTAEKPAAKKAAKTPSKKPSKPKAEAPAVPKVLKISKEDRLPKRARSAYNFFYTDYYKEHGPAASLPEVHAIAKAAGARWKTLSEEDKKKYHDAADRSSAEYQKTMSEYLQRVDPKVLKAIDQQRKAKGTSRFSTPPSLKHLRIKRPRTGFVRFRDDLASTLDVPSDLKGVHRGRYLMVEASKQWKELPEEKKAPYLEAFRKERDERLAESKGSAT